MGFLLLIALLAGAEGDPVVLSNEVVRVEIDPLLFCVRYVGFSGGLNFLDSLYVPDKLRKGAEWVDPGGLTTELVPDPGHDPAVRRGPAEVIERTPLSATLLGPVSDALHVRLKKTVEIDPHRPIARYTVAILATRPGPIKLGVCSTARVPQGTLLRVDRPDGAIRVLSGAGEVSSVAKEIADSWQLSVPPALALDRVVVGGFVTRIEQENRDGVWMRRIVTMPASPAEVPHEATFLCVLDNGTASYGAALQGSPAKVTPAGPLVFVEEWTLVPKAARASK